MYSSNLRIPEDLLERVKASAKKNRRSMNGEILQAIEVYLDVQERPNVHNIIALQKQYLALEHGAERTAFLLKEFGKRGLILQKVFEEEIS
jgi:hypothetical protein